MTNQNDQSVPGTQRKHQKNVNYPKVSQAITQTVNRAGVRQDVLRANQSIFFLAVTQYFSWPFSVRCCAFARESTADTCNQHTVSSALA